MTQHIIRRLTWLRYRLFAAGLAHLPDPLRWGYYRRRLGVTRIIGGPGPSAPRPPWVDEAVWKALTEEKP